MIVRILDPARAALYEQLGLEIICPTRTAIETLTSRVLESAREGERSRVFVIVAGGGKVGSNVARSLMGQRPRGRR